MPPARRIYLDNAATSWPKPEAVYLAVDRFQRDIGAAAGRGSYREALESGRIVETARAGVARLIAAGDPRQIVFTSCGTDSLNTALHGFLGRGDHVVTTTVEHNSVLRPLRGLEERSGVSVTRVACDSLGLVDPADIRLALRPETKLIAVIHASNVTGAIQPVAEIGRIARNRGAAFLVDAAQTLGHLPLSVDELMIDLLAAPAHKGLLAPLGTGILYVRSGLEPSVCSFRQGGTGTRSEEDRQPDGMPDKFESGNLNVAGLAGLAAAIDFLEARGLAAIRRHEVDMLDRFLNGLRELAGVCAFGPRDLESRAGVVSLRIEGYDPQEVAAVLDGSYGIQVRPGLHCAPLVHKSIGTFSAGGTVRFSFSPFTTADEIDAALSSLQEIVRAASGSA
jgi:cysteine desulfurase family protein